MKRRLLASSALIGAAALAACASIPASTVAQVETAIGIAQAAISYMSPFVPLVAAFVPAAAPLVPEITLGLSALSVALNGLSSTMTTASAQTGVAAFVTDGKGVAATAAKVVALIPAGNSQAVATATAIAGEFNAALSQLAGFAASGTVPVVASARMGAAVAPPLFVRVVR